MTDTVRKATSDRSRPGGEDPRPVLQESPREGPIGLSPVRIDGAEVEIPKPEPRYPYWLGTTEECPLQTVTAGGVEFPRAQGKLSDENGNPITNLARGRIAHLTEAEARLAAQRIAERVVRTNGSRRDVLSTRGNHSRPYRARPDDVPLGRFVYLIRLGDSLPHDWRERSPTTMA